MRSAWRCSDGLNPKYTEAIAINRQGLEMDKFVHDYLPEHLEMLRWDPRVNYSLKKRGRWKMLERVATVWQEQGVELAEETFDIQIGDVGRVKPFLDRWDKVGHRRLYRNHGEVVRKTNLTKRPRYLSSRLKTWEEGDPTKVEEKMSKKGYPSNMCFSHQSTGLGSLEKNNKVDIMVLNNGPECKERRTQIPLRCHASDKYTRRVIHETVSRIHKHQVGLLEKEEFCNDEFICGCEELESVDAVNVVDEIERKKMTVCLKDAIKKRIKSKKKEKMPRRTIIKN